MSELPSPFRFLGKAGGDVTATFVSAAQTRVDMFIRPDGCVEMAVGTPDERNWFELHIGDLKELVTQIEALAKKEFGDDWEERSVQG